MTSGLAVSFSKSEPKGTIVHVCDQRRLKSFDSFCMFSMSLLSSAKYAQELSIYARVPRCQLLSMPKNLSVVKDCQKTEVANRRLTRLPLRWFCVLQLLPGPIHGPLQNLPQAFWPLPPHANRVQKLSENISRREPGLGAHSLRSIYPVMCMQERR